MDRMPLNARGSMPPYLNNSLAVRQEIQRFESVHPSIYAIYDLIEGIPDPLIQQQIREHVVCIEDSFVNSQEWTLSRAVPDIKLGILGSINSGKSALVHRYLTGSYMQEESPEGGRFKKEVVIDGVSYLQLIRDEGGAPEMQFTHWVDAVIFVFSLENEASFNAIYTYYAKMAHYRNTTEIPLILVGTQDAISESNPRLIDDAKARKLANDLKRCSYYETCATYGLNVERVFQDACQKVIHQRMSMIPVHTQRPNTPNHATLRGGQQTMMSIPGMVKAYDAQQPILSMATSVNSHTLQGHSPPYKDTLGNKLDKDHHRTKHKEHRHRERSGSGDKEHRERDRSSGGSGDVAHIRHSTGSSSSRGEPQHGAVPVPCPVPPSVPPPPGPPPPDMPPRQMEQSTALQQAQQKKADDDKAVGSGRAIPVKQGFLYKKSSKPLNKDWKKKYVTLTNNAKLTYHSSMQDYRNETHGKEIDLSKTTVKMPGGRPRGSQQTPAGKNSTNGDSNPSSTFEMEGGAMVIPNASLTGGSPTNKNDTPNIKKRHKRAKSGANKTQDGDDSDGYEFSIVSIENKAWHFEAGNPEDREEWVSAIEQQIQLSFQGSESTKSKGRSNTSSNPVAVSSIRSAKGNSNCADCDSKDPEWASLNLGALICIECSGIHRNLGTHVSRVRSLGLDEWSPELIQVMLAIGNQMANGVWEANTKGKLKPVSAASREEKEKWIRAKYEAKEFLPPPPFLNVPLGQQLIDAVARQDIHNAICVLAYAKPDQVNNPYSPTDTRTALHIAAALGNLVMVQLLIWYGADVNLKDHEGRNALWYARSANSEDCAEILKSAGCSEHPTLPRRRSANKDAPAPPPKGSENSAFDKLPASVI